MNSLNRTEISQPGIAGYIFNGPVISEAGDKDNTLETWIAVLNQLAREHEREEREDKEQERANRNARPAAGPAPADEIPAPLPRLAAGPWRSLGGCFDYKDWPERDRFLELDMLIASSQDPRGTDLENDRTTF